MFPGLLHTFQGLHQKILSEELLQPLKDSPSSHVPRPMIYLNWEPAHVCSNTKVLSHTTPNILTLA